MSKIVCDICGTTYPEVETHCPICGSARAADAQVVESPSASSGYTYVRGGRFSKANVRKRNSGKAPAKAAPKQPKPVKKTETPAPQKKDNRNASDSNRGLIITAVVLLIAVLFVVGYIAMRYFFVPEEEGAANVKDTIPCVSVTAGNEDIILKDGAETFQLNVTTTPTNTTDAVKFESLDSSIATVDEKGLITATAPGTVQIKITCGDKVHLMKVVSSVNEVKLNLTRVSLQLTFKGETYILYIKEISGIEPSEITWTSDNEEVVTIEDGVVTAEGVGVTDVHGEYNGYKVSCAVTVEFEDENDGEGGNGVGEDDGSGDVNNGTGEDNGDANTGTGEDNGNAAPVNELAIYALWGTKLTDISVQRNEVVTLVVKDSAGNTVDATISVENTSICSVSGKEITSIGQGITTVTATYNGITTTCLVRCY